MARLPARNHGTRRKALLVSPISLLALALGASASAAEPEPQPRFLADDPVFVDRDDIDMGLPREVELSTAWDAIENTFFGPELENPVPPAVNVNTLGEVPDSSWFENRIGVRAMSIPELVRGPDSGPGPDTENEWSVIGAKSGGITPGFTIKDARGDVYFVKFDPAAYPNLSTGADVVSTKFFYAFGYHVPENYVAYFHRGKLKVAPGTRLKIPGGGRRPMTEEDLDRMLENVPRREDGRIRCLASLRLTGIPLGPHKYYGTRPDDPNDVFPHEHRRDLRGLRVFSAWLNHDDSRSVNSLDMYVSEGGRRYVKHHLIDFGSTLGTGSDERRRIAPQGLRAGHEYVIEWGPILKTAVTLGLWERPWRRVEYEVYPEVGRIESDFFHPARWKPEYPNAAFERMNPVDAFWAARIVARFGDEAIRAIVKTGDYGDPEAERHLGDVIIARRDKTLAHYFSLLNPLAGFRLEGSAEGAALVFDNEAERAGLGDGSQYRYEWLGFDNAARSERSLAPAATTRKRRLTLPAERPEYLLVRLETLHPRQPGWAKRVGVYLRTAPELALVGIEREE